MRDPESTPQAAHRGTLESAVSLHVGSDGPKRERGFQGGSSKCGLCRDVCTLSVLPTFHDLLYLIVFE
jgi:hypothetical protein